MDRVRPTTAADAADWTLLAALLTLLDAAATWAWLTTGIATELNPLLVGLIERVGATPTLVLRGTVGVALVIGLGVLALLHRTAATALVAITVALGTVALWHVAGAVWVLA